MSDEIEAVDIEQNKDIEHLKQDVSEAKDGLKEHLDDCSNWRQKVTERLHMIEKKGMWALIVILFGLVATQNETVQMWINWIL